MDTLQYLLTGLAAAMSLQNLGFALIGCVLGTLIGVLPGLGPTAGTAILIPLTFQLDPTGAIIMLSAIYYGAMYGGTITSVLINVPRTQPISAKLRFCRLVAAVSPATRCWKVSTIRLKVRARRSAAAP